MSIYQKDKNIQEQKEAQQVHGTNRLSGLTDFARSAGLVGSGGLQSSTVPKDKQETILEEAARITSGDREKQYGHPKVQFERLKGMWSAILGKEVTCQEIGLCLIALKISRLIESSTRDSLVDIAGYARILERLSE